MNSKNSHSVLTFVSRTVPKLHEYDIFENCWFLSMTTATKSNHFKQRRQTPVRSFVRSYERGHTRPTVAMRTESASAAAATATATTSRGMGGSSGVDLPSILRALKQTQSGGAERDGEAFATRLREALPALMENYFNPINGA